MTKKEILELIAKYKKMHAEYKKAFYENGIDANEQQQLDSLEAKIKDLEKLLEVANSEESPMITKNESLTKVTSADANNDNDDWEKILIDWLEKNKVEILKTFTAPSKDKLKEEFINMDLTSAEDKITKLIKQFQGDMREKSPSVPNEYLRTAIKKWLKNNDIYIEFESVQENPEELKLSGNIFPKLSKKQGFSWKVKDKKLYLEVDQIKLGLSGSSSRDTDVYVDSKGKMKIKHELNSNIELSIKKEIVNFKFKLDTNGTLSYKFEFTCKGNGYLSKKAANQIELNSELIYKIVEEISSGDLNQETIDLKLEKIENSINLTETLLKEETTKREDIIFWLGQKAKPGENADIQIGIKYNF
jgi:hypothetical protein